jgi:hypothetical protein
MGDSANGTAGGASRLRSFNPVRIADIEYRVWVAYYRRQWLRLLVAYAGLVHVGFGMDWLRTLHGAWLVLRANQLWAPAADNDPDGARRCMRRFYGLVRLTCGEPQDVAEAARLEVDWWRAHRERQRPATPTNSNTAGTAGDGTAEAGATEARTTETLTTGARTTETRTTGAGTTEAGTTEAGTANDEAGQRGDELVDALTRLYALLYREPESEVRPAAAHRAHAMDISDQWVAEGCPADSPLLALERAALVRSYAALLAAVHH